jgi:hypothetical protein
VVLSSTPGIYLFLYGYDYNGTFIGSWQFYNFIGSGAGNRVHGAGNYISVIVGGVRNTIPGQGNYKNK